MCALATTNTQTTTQTNKTTTKQKQSYAVYFVQRGGAKPAGNFSGAAGVSFNLDPITHDADAPQVCVVCVLVLMCCRAKCDA